MNVGLFFGSFNPIHHGHLILASHVLHVCRLDQIWFIVSPHNPLKESGNLLNEYQRLHLVRLAIEGNSDFRALDIEFHLPRPSYTIDTLTYMGEKFPNHSFKLILGSDSILNMHKWKNPESILSNYDILVYQRPGFLINETLRDRTTIVAAPLLDISASMIRKMIRSELSIRYYVPDIVMDEIEKGGYYKKLQYPTKK